MGKQHRPTNKVLAKQDPPNLRRVEDRHCTHLQLNYFSVNSIERKCSLGSCFSYRCGGAQEECITESRLARQASAYPCCAEMISTMCRFRRSRASCAILAAGDCTLEPRPCLVQLVSQWSRRSLLRLQLFDTLLEARRCVQAACAEHIACSSCCFACCSGVLCSAFGDRRTWTVPPENISELFPRAQKTKSNHVNK